MRLALLGAVALMAWPVPQGQPVAFNVSVAGQVLDAESRQPIEGARVIFMSTAQVLPAAGAGPLETLTNAKGQFVFDLAPGRYRLDALKPGFVPLSDTPDSL